MVLLGALEGKTTVWCSSRRKTYTAGRTVHLSTVSLTGKSPGYIYIPACLHISSLETQLSLAGWRKMDDKRFCAEDIRSWNSSQVRS